MLRIKTLKVFQIEECQEVQIGNRKSKIENWVADELALRSIPISKRKTLLGKSAALPSLPPLPSLWWGDLDEDPLLFPWSLESQTLSLSSDQCGKYHCGWNWKNAFGDGVGKRVEGERNLCGHSEQRL